jgi:hypothetical protein
MKIKRQGKSHEKYLGIAGSKKTDSSENIFSPILFIFRSRTRA